MSSYLSVPMAGRSLRNLLSRPATVRYPLETKPAIAGARGMVEFDLATCVFCGLCARRCPAAAIACSREERTFSLDALRCVACGVCAEVCNKGSLSMATEHRPVMASAGTGAPRPGHRTWQGEVPDVAAKPEVTPRRDAPARPAASEDHETPSKPEATARPEAPARSDPAAEPESPSQPATEPAGEDETKAA